MAKKQVIRFSGSDIRSIVKESVIRIISEANLNDVNPDSGKNKFAVYRKGKTMFNSNQEKQLVKNNINYNQASYLCDKYKDNPNWTYWVGYAQ